MEKGNEANVDEGCCSDVKISSYRPTRFLLIDQQAKTVSPLLHSCPNTLKLILARNNTIFIPNPGGKEGQVNVDEGQDCF